MEIIRIHTRTNNVDNRVHDLFCSHIRINDRPEFERWVLTQMYSICKNHGPVKWVRIVQWTWSIPRLRMWGLTMLKSVQREKKYMYGRVCITYCNHIRRQWGSQLGRIVRSTSRKCQGERAYKSGNHSTECLWEPVAEWEPWTWYTKYVETLVFRRRALEGLHII